jgi:hypothetical protein
MKQRCYNSKDSAYPDYGGRGITVCKRWHDFSLFFKDMGKGYRDGLTIERKDNDGPYSPQNCCWATRTVQANNRQHTKRWMHSGKMKTLRQLADISSLKMDTIKMRLIYGWSAERATTEPVLSSGNRTHCNQGSLHGLSKLTERKVIRIRNSAKKGIPNRAIAKQFGLTASNVGYIVKRKTWKHI